MSHRVYAFEPPERFVVGTVGEPGDRTFYLQASGDGRVVSVVLEKVQVSLLAEKLEELLAEARRRFGVAADEIAEIDNDPLQAPIEEEFRVGTLGLAFDVDTSTVVIEAIEVGDGDADESEDDLDRLRVRITPAETRAFIERARRVVAAGRPPCPLCGQPLDPTGHVCPRHNGYHRYPTPQ
ncbi:MAG: DUF3090 family protein [Micromonosporaceae bacterium]|jgi:uncharacterized repeat protein (TIGR03847 family)